MSLLSSAVVLVASSLAMDDAARRIERSVVVAAPIDVVYSKWTTREGLAFIAEDAKVELRVGGAYEWYFSLAAPEGQRGGEGCTVLAFVANELLAFSWNAPPSIPELRDAGARSQVIVTFRALDPGTTLVRLVHAGMGEGQPWERYQAYFEKAWPSVLEALRKSFPSEVGSDAPLRQEVIMDAPLETVWRDHTTKQGLESWMVPVAEIDLRVGGTLRTSYTGVLDPANTIETTILAYEPMALLALKAVKAPDGSPFAAALQGKWAVTTFEAVGASRTRVTLVGLGYDDSDASRSMRKFFEAGNRATYEPLIAKYAAARK